MATAGWKNFYPDRPSTFEEIADPAIYDAHKRLARMDEYGLHAQIVYPNIGGFGSWMSISDVELREACVRAYNDFVIEWASADADRLVPMMGVPFWDVRPRSPKWNDAPTRVQGDVLRQTSGGGRPAAADEPRM